jgi:hypothetical protein
MAYMVNPWEKNWVECANKLSFVITLTPNSEVCHLIPSISNALLSQLHDLGHIVLGIYLPIRIDFLRRCIRWAL